MMMKKLLLTVCALAMTTLTVAQSVPKRIVVDVHPTTTEMHAASELQEIMRMGGVNLPIVSRRDTARQAGCIYVGTNPMADTDSLPAGSYMMHGDGSSFALCGKEPKGTLYAVYDFLERYCSCRLYTPTALVVPDLKGFAIPDNTAAVERPAFEYREVLYYYPNHSRRYADWHRLQTREDLNRDWGMFVHTFKNLVPAATYFESHPEWFSMCDGKRVRDGQLCLSNSMVLDTLCDNLKRMVDARPEARIWSVSNNDNYNVCQCSECLRMDSLYGGPTGTLLHFINQVARRFPNKTISTLAYQYTRSAPEGFKERPDSNVNIMFCSIECGREESIATSPKEASFRRDMENWKQLTDNIFMWDYVVQFRNFWDPFPNLHVLKPNLQYFRDNGVKMMFEQGTGEDNKTSWMEMRTYLIAKLMWNPDLDIDSLMDDFCNGYYGAAGIHVRHIVDTMTAALIASGQRLDIYGFPVDAADGYLSPKRMAFYRDEMSRAYGVAGSDSLLHERLRYFELALDFAAVELATAGHRGELFPGNREEQVDRMVNMRDRLVDDLVRFGVPQMMEMGISPEEYGEVIDNYLRKSISSGPAYRRPVKLRKQPTPPYAHNHPGGGGQLLTDGEGGIMDYRRAWLGFWGDTLDAVVTLGESPVKIQAVSMDFYFYPLSWIFLPQRIEFMVSNDGRHWTSLGTHSPGNPETLATPQMKTFCTRTPHLVSARYLRVVAIPLPEIPSWHRATGHPAWIFTDEIVVE